MAILAKTVTVATTATILHTFTNEIQTAKVEVPNAGTTIYIGGSAVTSAAGLPVVANAVVEVKGHANDVLYGITASGTSDTRVLVVGA